ncbi:MAG TPA: hypothetical protein VEU32_09240 [Burkholderiales bacterium]|nr:hypothetical protein [Burkholderiales bacterium]
MLRLLLGGALIVASAATHAQDQGGLRADAAAHGAWSAYGRLSFDIGTDRYYVYERAGDEFSAAVIDRKSDMVRIRAVSIAGAGLFYFPAGASPCQPDAIERLGLYAELVLFYLSSAFPDGPQAVHAGASAVVDKPIPELHFMQGVMKSREGARTVVSLSPRTGPKIDYVLQDDRDNVKGTWDATRLSQVVPDDEPLARWHTCWAGSWQREKGRSPVFKPRLEDARTLKTFGEVRRALRGAGR